MDTGNGALSAVERGGLPTRGTRKTPLQTSKGVLHQSCWATFTRPPARDILQFERNDENRNRQGAHREEALGGVRIRLVSGV